MKIKIVKTAFNEYNNRMTTDKIPFVTMPWGYKSKKLAEIFNLIIKFSLFLLPFIIFVVSDSMPFPYITGKGFLFKIFVEIIFVLYLLILILRPRGYLPKKNLILFVFAAWILSMLVSDLSGVNFYQSFWSNYERMDGLILHIHLFALFIVLISIFNKRNWLIFFHSSIFASIIISFFAYLEYSNVTQGGKRVITTVGNPIYLASYMLIHLFIIAFYFAKFKNKKIKLCYLLIFSFELPIIFITGTRSVALGLIAAFIIGLFIKLFIEKSIKIKLIIGAIIVILLISPFLLIAGQNTRSIKSNPILSRFSSIDITKGTAKSRLLIWQIALDSWRQKPLLGWGQENFIVPYAANYKLIFYGNEPWFDRPHNSILRILVETGVFGLVIFLTLIVSVGLKLREIHKDKKWNANQLIVFTSFSIGYFTQSLFVFDNLVTYIPLIAILAFLASATSDNKKEERKSKFREKFKFFKIALIIFLLFSGIWLSVKINYNDIKHAKSFIKISHSIYENQPPDIIISRFKKTMDINSFGKKETVKAMAGFLLQNFYQNPFQEWRFAELLDAVIDELENIHKQSPSDLRWFSLLVQAKETRAHANQRDDLFAEVDIMYGKIINEWPNYPQNYIYAAQYYLRRDMKKEAMEIIRELATKPGDKSQKLIEIINEARAIAKH